MENFKICSFNCKNFNGALKREYVSSLMKDCDFVCLQEHHMFESELCNFVDLCNGQPLVMYTGTSAMDPHSFHRGRKYGGTAILWKGTIQWSVNPVRTASKRLSAVTVTLPNDSKMILFCVYMPCDEGYRGSNLNEYQNILDEISTISQEQDIDSICIAGDFNTDISRDNPQTNELIQFCNNENLCLLKNNSFSQVDYTFESACASRSCIDHIIVSQNLNDGVEKYTCLFDVNNGSDHVPVIAEFVFDCEYLKNNGVIKNNKTMWYKANENDIDKYKASLNVNLDNFVKDCMTGVLDCLDPHCKSDEHVCCLENLYGAIIDACLLSSEVTIPQSKNKHNQKKCSMPGFNEYVKEYMDNAMEWHRVWKMQGRPAQGYVAEMRKQTRKQYHNKVKMVKQQESAIRSERMAEAIRKGKQRDLWQCIRSYKKKNGLPSCVDGCNDPAGISQIFADKYKSLYNSVPYNRDELLDIQNRNGAKLNQNYLFQAMFDVENVRKAISFLKYNKYDGNIGLYSDNIIHGTDKLYQLLAKLFNGMLVHGCSIGDMFRGTLTPIVKDKRSKLSNSDNFRSICLQNVLCKLLDVMILCKETDCLSTSNMQFGFKPKSSTSLACSMFLETTDYYVKNGGNVFALALDASKAFDRVNYVQLFKLLETRKLNPVYIRFLLDNYVSQELRVSYNNKSSEWFRVSNGVKQGAVLSPTLFSVYVDNLLRKITDAGLGCNIGHVCCGIIGYADDILLLAPTVQSLNKMINICEDYANEYDIKFNGTKSQLMVFGKCKENIEIYVCGEKVKIVSEMKYLGNIISNKINDPLVQHVRNDFVCKVNSFLANFSDVSSYVKNNLFQQYCLSLYGSNLCMFDHSSMNDLRVAWRKAIRRLWKLPYKTHCNLLPNICMHTPVDICIYKRFSKHFISSLSHKNEAVSTVFRSSMFYMSRLSNNFRYITSYCDMNPWSAINKSVGAMSDAITCKYNNSSHDCDKRIGMQIQELCVQRDSHLEDWFLDKEEIDMILKCLCTD